MAQRSPHGTAKGGGALVVHENGPLMNCHDRTYSGPEVR